MVVGGGVDDGERVGGRGAEQVRDEVRGAEERGELQRGVAVGERGGGEEGVREEVGGCGLEVEGAEEVCEVVEGGGRGLVGRGGGAGLRLGGVGSGGGGRSHGGGDWGWVGVTVEVGRGEGGGGGGGAHGCGEREAVRCFIQGGTGRGHDKLARGHDKVGGLY